ncbi:3-ketoacyl-ACP reductase [Paraburkholderia susongensis]|uniref:NAD(P)-dependent dehydrogenase, short-chain alcohol dehydrogenase family n=1 Tax=Paraburkholderia susongensis TaxID=1515439 RepID=A0A1X7LYR7_9BURK|nr:3-ketoacyl-ACP reductase [Paraburkholderia susongensis]SMG59058.1 NAD(P)-dependent dehydrogenase, short-chain alcohol dehydrogenase family [Paraburkholderia susongensis]
MATSSPVLAPRHGRPLALVTGARRGIGASIAAELAQRGFDLALIDIDEDGARETLAAVESHGARARFYRHDLADGVAHRALVERIVSESGPIACLVNNAGVSADQRGDLLELGERSYDRVVDINMRGTFFLTQAVARHMATTASDDARSIVTVSSVSAELASTERGEYCMSKAGLGMLTKLFALRLAPLSIGVFEVRPGIIRTPMTEAVAARYDERIAEGIVPMRRWGVPQDVASAVATLASGQMAFATGSVLNIDGALSIPRL